jgi:cytochrome c oxidase subunit 1
MLLFAIGGWGGAINASFGLNSIVHNTSWIPGHFHTTVGGAVALTFMGTAYIVVPRLLGRQLELAPVTRVQPWLWFTGMLLFSIPTHLTGLLGMPRRVFDPSYGNHATAVSWQWLTNLSAIGGLVLFASSLFFVLPMLFTLFGSYGSSGPIELAEPLEDPRGKWAYLDRLGTLTALAVVLIVIAYGYPIWQHLQMPRFGSPGYSPF